MTLPTIEERRQEPDLATLHSLLVQLDAKIDNHLAEEAELKPKLLVLLSILEQSKGALTFIKWLAAASTVAVATYGWLTTHVVWKG